MYFIPSLTVQSDVSDDDWGLSVYDMLELTTVQKHVSLFLSIMFLSTHVDHYR
jgi:hypothetical protein